jgi:hypothetical protein
MDLEVFMPISISRELATIANVTWTHGACSLSIFSELAVTYLNIFLLTQNVHHREAVVEGKSDEETAQAELPEVANKSGGYTCEWTRKSFGGE